MPEKGTTAVWDDDRLVFADIRSPRTVANLRQNPAIEINVVDPVSRKGYRFKGTGAVLTEGNQFDGVFEFYCDRGVTNEIRAAVLVEVKRALPLTSPTYDLGATEEEVAPRVPCGLCEHLREYWNAGFGPPLYPPYGWGGQTRGNAKSRKLVELRLSV